MYRCNSYTNAVILVLTEPHGHEAVLSVILVQDNRDCRNKCAHLASLSNARAVLPIMPKQDDGRT